MPPPNDAAARRTGGSSFVPMLPSTLHRSRSHKCSHRVVGLVYSSTDIESEWPSIYDARPVSHVRWLCVTIVYLDWSVALSRSVLFSSRFSASGRSLVSVSTSKERRQESPVICPATAAVVGPCPPQRRFISANIFCRGFCDMFCLRRKSPISLSSILSMRATPSSTREATLNL